MNLIPMGNIGDALIQNLRYSFVKKDYGSRSFRKGAASYYMPVSQVALYSIVQDDQLLQFKIIIYSVEKELLKCS